jgi:hypothetical protein
VYGTAQLASFLAYAAAGPLVALTSPRAVFLIAATGMLIGLAVTAPALTSATVNVGAAERVRNNPLKMEENDLSSLVARKSLLIALSPVAKPYRSRPRAEGGRGHRRARARASPGSWAASSWPWASPQSRLRPPAS